MSAGNIFPSYSAYQNHSESEMDDDKYTIIYVFVPLQEEEKYLNDECVSICKIGMTTSPSLSFSDVQKSIIMRGKSTGYPYEMKVVDYLVFDKTSVKIDNIFRAIVFEFCKQQDISARISATINSNQDFVINPGREFVYNCKKTPVDLSKKLVQYVISGKKDAIYETLLESCNEKILYNLSQFRGMKYFVPVGKEPVSRTENCSVNYNDYVDSSSGFEHKNRAVNDVVADFLSVSTVDNGFDLDSVCNISHSVAIKSEYGKELCSSENSYTGQMMKVLFSKENREKTGELLAELNELMEYRGIRFCESREYDRIRKDFLEMVKCLPVEKRMFDVSFSDVWKFDVSVSEEEYFQRLVDAVKFQYCLFYQATDSKDAFMILTMYCLYLQLLVKRYRNEYKMWRIGSGPAKYTDNYKYLGSKWWSKVVDSVQEHMCEKDGKFHIVSYDLYEPVDNGIPFIEIVKNSFIDLNNITVEQWNKIVEITRRECGRDEIVPEDIMRVFNEEIVENDYMYRNEDDGIRIDEVIDYIEKFSKR